MRKSRGEEESRRGSRGRRVAGGAAIELLEERLVLAAFLAPAELSSSAGLLDVTLRQTPIRSSAPFPFEVAGSGSQSVQGFFLYEWTLNSGQSSGAREGMSYPAPTLRVNPGDHLRIHLENDLENLAGIPGETDTSQPTNLHTHGLHVSPLGNSDNVLLSIPAGMANTFEYQIPDDAEQGAFWYHPHRHEVVKDQVARGLAGFLVVGRPDGDVDQLDSLPIRMMSLQLQNLVTTTSPISIQPAIFGTQFTLNGQFQPTLAMTSASEVWVLGNFNSELVLKLEAAAGSPITFSTVAVDGESLAQAVPTSQLLIPPGGRLAVLVNATQPGATVSFTVSTASNGAPPPAPGQITTQSLFTAQTPAAGSPTVSPTTVLTSPRVYQDLSTVVAPTQRQVVFTQMTGPNIPPIFEINHQQFPNNPVFQPRLGSVEEWVLINDSGENHVFHLHVNDFQVMSIHFPSNPGNDQTAPSQFWQDSINIAPARKDANGKVVLNPDGTVADPGKIVLRIKHVDYLGEAVYHCHILGHEYLGMMALVNIIPEVPPYATAPGPGPRAEVVRIYSGITNEQTAAFLPFGPHFRGGASVAMADVNADGVIDAIIGAGVGGRGRVAVFDGATNFTSTLWGFHAFANSPRTGALRVAGGDLDADGHADIIVSTAHGAPVVRAFSGKDGSLLTEFRAYDPRLIGGVSLAAGDVDGSGRIRIITGAGPGGAPRVRVWGFDLYTPIVMDAQHAHASGTVLGQPRMISEFDAFRAGFRQGVNVAAGLYSAETGGFSRIVTSSARGVAPISVWALEGTGPGAQAHSAKAVRASVSPSSAARHSPLKLGSRVLPVRAASNGHGDSSTFLKQTEFAAIGLGVGRGQSVALVSTLTGADLVVGSGAGASARVQRYQFVLGQALPQLVDTIDAYGRFFRGGLQLGGF